MPWPAHVKANVSAQGLDLIDAMLTMLPSDRISAEAALRHLFLVHGASPLGGMVDRGCLAPVVPGALGLVWQDNPEQRGRYVYILMSTVGLRIRVLPSPIAVRPSACLWGGWREFGVSGSCF